MWCLVFMLHIFAFFSSFQLKYFLFLSAFHITSFFLHRQIIFHSFLFAPLIDGTRNNIDSALCGAVTRANEKISSLFISLINMHATNNSNYSFFSHARADLSSIPRCSTVSHFLIKPRRCGARLYSSKALERMSGKTAKIVKKMKQKCERSKIRWY